MMGNGDVDGNAGWRQRQTLRLQNNLIIGNMVRFGDLMAVSA